MPGRDHFPVNTRVLRAHKDAALAALIAGPYGSSNELLDAIATAVLTAADDKMRYVVVSQDRASRTTLAYGPYASRGVAEKAIDRGYCAWTEHTDAMVVPMTPAPKKADLPSKPKRKPGQQNWEQMEMFGEDEL
jgi:hypothetical protein